MKIIKPIIMDTKEAKSTAAAIISFISFTYVSILGFRTSVILSTALLASSMSITRPISIINTIHSILLTSKYEANNITTMPAIDCILRFCSSLKVFAKPLIAYIKLLPSLLSRNILSLSFRPVRQPAERGEIP